MNKKIIISLPEELILELIKEAENHRETFEDLILRKLKYNDLSFRAPDDFFQKKIIKISIDDLTSESMKQEEFDKLLNEVLEDYFSKTSEEQNKIAEEILKKIREEKQKKEEKSVSINEEGESELKIPESIWDEIFDDRRTREEIKRDIEELKKKKRNNDLDNE